MTIKRILTLLLTGLLMATPVAAQRVNDAAVIRQINTAASKLRTMQCDFVQTKYMRMLNDKIMSRGHMYYAQPNRLRWEYTSPYTYIFVLNNSQVLMRKGRNSQVVDVNQSRVFKEITRIMMNSVVGKCLSDRKDFKTSIAATQTEWIATLVPQKKNLRQMFKTIRIHFNKRRLMVSVVELYENNGDRMVIELKNVRANQNINASLFSVR